MKYNTISVHHQDSGNFQWYFITFNGQLIPQFLDTCILVEALNSCFEKAISIPNESLQSTDFYNSLIH